MALTPEMIAEQFGRAAPIGTECLYFPARPFDRAEAVRTRVASAPWVLGSGHVVVSLDGLSGGRSIEFICFDSETQRWPDTAPSESREDGMDETRRPKTKSRSNAFDQAIGQRLRIARMERGMGQEKLADAIGVTFQQVQKYEKGVNRIAAGRLVRIAEVLGRPAAWFLGEGAPMAAEAAAELGIVNRMLLSGQRGVALAENFLALPPDLQVKVADIVRGLAEVHRAAGAGATAQRAA